MDDLHKYKNKDNRYVSNLLVNNFLSLMLVNAFT